MTGRGVCVREEGREEVIILQICHEGKIKQIRHLSAQHRQPDLAESVQTVPALCL